LSVLHVRVCEVGVSAVKFMRKCANGLNVLPPQRFI